MSSISSYDELNIILGKRRSEPYEEYFSKMSISDKEKRERVAFSEQMEEVILYILALIETTIESGETNREYIQTQFYDKYLDVVLEYMMIGSYIKGYVLETSKQIIDTTFCISPGNLLIQNRLQMIITCLMTGQCSFPNAKPIRF